MQRQRKHRPICCEMDETGIQIQLYILVSNNARADHFCLVK
jgi:hypothetical protein